MTFLHHQLLSREWTESGTESGTDLYCPTLFSSLSELRVCKISHCYLSMCALGDIMSHSLFILFSLSNTLISLSN